MSLPVLIFCFQNLATILKTKNKNSWADDEEEEKVFQLPTNKNTSPLFNDFAFTYLL